MAAMHAERIIVVAGTFALIRAWQTYLEVSGECNANTRRQYRRALTGFLADIATELGDLTEDDIVAGLASLDPHGQMRGIVLRALKSYYRWAVPRGHAELDHVARLRVKRPRLAPAPYVDRGELDQVFLAAEKIDPRARWALELAYASGARVSELCALTADDVAGGVIRFRIAKGDRPRSLPAGPRAKLAIARLLELADYMPPTVARRRPTLVGVGPTTVWKWAHLAGEASGMKTWPHLLRHAFVTRLAEDPRIAPRTIQELAGWADLSQLPRYAAVRDEARESAVQLL